MLERLLPFFGKYPLDLATHLSSSLPIIFGCVRRYYLRKNGKFIWYLFLFFFIKDTYALIHMFLIPNIYYIQNIEVIIETIGIGIVFYYSYDRMYKYLVLLFTIFCSFIEVIFYKETDISSVSLSVFRFFSIILSLIYFNKILTDMRLRSITKHTMFWFTAGLFVYTAGTFFIFLFSEYIYDIRRISTEIFDKFWNVSQVLFIIFCLLSTYGIWISKDEGKNFI